MGLPLHKFCAELSRLGFREGEGEGKGEGEGEGDVSRLVDWLRRLPAQQRRHAAMLCFTAVT
jgi:hypothetical protein